MRTLDDYLVRSYNDGSEEPIMVCWGESVEDNTALLLQGYEMLATIGLDGVDVPYN